MRCGRWLLPVMVAMAAAAPARTARRTEVAEAGVTLEIGTAVAVTAKTTELARQAMRRERQVVDAATPGAPPPTERARQTTATRLAEGSAFLTGDALAVEPSPTHPAATPLATASPQLTVTSPSATRQAGDVWVDRVAAIRFRYVPPGRFTMGSPPDEVGRDRDEAQHEVTLTRGTWVGETEVTQRQWRAIMSSDPSSNAACGDNCPVEQVSWLDAVEFANALSQQAGLAACYRVSGSDVSFVGLGCEGYRLPTEAEWEWAARAQGPGPYAGGADLGALAWYGDNAEGTTHPVAQKRANAWGLADMSGNVWEWAWDWHGGYPTAAVTDPLGPSSGTSRAVRGGNWWNAAKYCRAASRGRNAPDRSNDDLGFRVVRTAD